MRTDKIIIAGAGIAGLSLAIQLAEKKIPCIVLEERNNFDGITSGVRISSKGVRVLEKMNIRDIGEPTRRTIMNYGGIVADFEVTNNGESPAIMVTRRAIFDKLIEKVKLLGIELITGFNLVSIIEIADGVEVISESGQRITGKLLVGADGVGSVVRKILNPNQPSGKTYAGYLGVGLITPSNAKIEMTLYEHPGNHVGIASIGKMSSADANKNIFFWTHLYMTEAEAKAMTNEKVMLMLDDTSHLWGDTLSQYYEMCKADKNLMIAHGPVYNGKMPNTWFSKNIFLIGDAAHPYGPGGQGISMALKDAEALCEMITSGDMSGEKKIAFQNMRSKECKKFGESAENRNKPEKQITTNLGLWWNGMFMKSLHFFKGGKIEM